MLVLDGFRDPRVPGVSTLWIPEVLDRPPSSAPGLSHRFCLAVCAGWGSPEPWKPVTGLKPGGASLLKGVGSFWGENLREFNFSVD